MAQRVIVPFLHFKVRSGVKAWRVKQACTRTRFPGLPLSFSLPGQANSGSVLHAQQGYMPNELSLSACAFLLFLEADNASSIVNTRKVSQLPILFPGIKDPFVETCFSE